MTEDTPGDATLPCSDPDAGDTIDIEILSLSLTGVSGPALGLVSGPITITPDLNHNGSGGSFTYQATDADGEISVISTAAIDITPVNDDPVCTDVSPTLTEDISNSISLPCSDPDIGDTIAVEILALSLTGISGPIVGPVTGPVPLNPDLNHNGSGGSFTYQATDTSLAINDTATATISITPVNDAPACNDLSVILTEDIAGAAAFSCSDVDAGDTIAIEIVSLSLTGISGPIVGPVVGSVPLNPDLNHNGSGGFFTYQATDTSLAVSGTSTATISVAAVNDSPVCNNLSVTLEEDIAGSASLSCSDVDAGDTIAIEIVSLSLTGISGPTVGSVTGPVPLNPSLNHEGSGDSFAYIAKDAALAPSNTATVSIDVTPVNDAPVCDDLSITLDEDTPDTATLPCSDPDAGDTIDIEILALRLTGVTGPVVGPVTGLVPLNPDLNHNGSGGSFTYQATDASLTVGNTGTATISVTPINDAPVCTDLSVTLTEDTPDTATLPCSDPDAGDTIDIEILALSLTGVTGPVVGPVTDPVPMNPDLNHNGSGGSFTYQATDSALAPSNTSTATIDITPVNDAPVCPDISVTLTEDVAGSTSLSCSDPDAGDTIDIEIVALSLTGVSGPVVGPVVGSVPLNPDLNHNGSGGSFTYQAKDAALTVSNTATVAVDVTPVNDAPICSDLSVTLAEDTPDTATLPCSDPDSGDTIDIEILALSLTGVTGPVVGPVTGTVPVNPDLNHNGSGGSFTYQATDSALAPSNTSTATIDVTAVNDAPVCPDVSVTLTEDVAGSASLSCTDVDAGDTIEIEIVSLSLTGVSGPIVGPVTGPVALNPALNHEGSGGSFAYQATDSSSAASNIANVSIDVTPVNDAPVCPDVVGSTPEDVSGSILLACSDPDTGDTVTIEIVSLSLTGVSGPVVGLVTGPVSLNPDLNHNGSGGSFTYQAKDVSLTVSNTATAGIDVSPVNDVPVLTGLPATESVDVGTSISATLDDKISDVETAPINISWIAITSNPLVATASVSPSHELIVETWAEGNATIQVQGTDRGDPDACGLPSPSCDASEKATHSIAVTVNAVTASGPRDLKETVIENLTPFAGESRRIKKAIREVGRSLDTRLWEGDLHLDTKQGHKVFDRERAAVRELMRVLRENYDDDDRHRRDEVSAEALAASEAAIDALVAADRLLAQTALDDAMAAEVLDPKRQKQVDKELARALQDMNRGDSEQADNDSDDAIKKYKSAWRHAQKAIKEAAREPRKPRDRNRGRGRDRDDGDSGDEDSNDDD
jgi:hypothetical protein